ncbi:T9SS type A sorting domain-containing protein [Dyadobacter tibetensis]|uniref:T9SS type A sorting domain-containing protein n=1 Tax=Dyadobacter tibetensis TaxID=1211851 RepID=UPI0004712EE6|nr:T9SS type A sorting domain-containing protein [Dyadobacter tibetensis]
MKIFNKISLSGYIILLTSVFCFGQQKGIIVTERSSTKGLVSFTESSTLVGISDTKHVDGYVKKYGAAILKFPVGNKGVYRPFAAGADGTLGAYFQTNPSAATLPAGAPFTITNRGSSVVTVSAREFWDIDGTNPTKITLSWNAASAVGELTGGAMNRLSIVGWNNTTSQWEKLTSTVDALALHGAESTLSSGSISTVESIVPNQYSVYTLGGLDQEVLPVNYAGVLEAVNCNEVTGWVWDQNYPSSELTVEVMEGNTVYGTGTANVFRQELKNNGTGTGKYGFKIALPAGLMNGQDRQISIRVRGSNHIISGSPKTVNCGFNGDFEVDCYAVKGWAWDKNFPNQQFTVELLVGGKVIESTLANHYRADLKNNGTGTGNYGFSFNFPVSYRNGQEQQLSIRIAGTTFMLAGSPKTMRCNTPNFRGSIDGADCNVFKGWVWDGAYPDANLTVELVEGNTVYATTTANMPRSDLQFGTGNYGYNLSPLPESLKDGQPHVLSMRVKGTDFQLLNSPKTITCSALPAFEGSFETADNSQFSGWVWDKNYPDRVLAVQLMEGSTVLATTMSTTYRADLAARGIGTGKYGFKAAIPASIMDNQPHELSIRVNGTDFVLAEKKTVSYSPTAAYRGSIDGADCNVFKGWAWDAGNPNTALVLELVEGNTVHATTTADMPRSDLQFGTGNYGYNLSPLPESLKDGQPHTLAMRVKGSTYLLENSPKTITCAIPPSYGGSFEVADCDYFSGWVWDKNYPDRVLAVQLMEGNTVLSTVMSTTYRSDLAANGTGTGKYGFKAALPVSLKDGKPHTLSIRINGTTHILAEQKVLTCGAATAYRGSIDGADCNVFKGWAWDAGNPNTALVLELVEGNTVHATTTADMPRSDLQFGTGNYGYNLSPLPESLKDGQPHTLAMRVKGSTYLLENSPKTITCAIPPSYGGSFEVADCDYFSGWVWDKNYPDRVLAVQLMEGNTVLSTVMSTTYRSDLAANGTGTGKYGFKAAIPVSLKDGKPHTLSIRINGTTHLLAEQKVLTCGAATAYKGSMEGADCNAFKGWAWDAGNPNTAMILELVEGNTVHATTTANMPRSDLQFGTGNYGYNLSPLPESLKDGQPHTLAMRVKGSTYLLENSPKTITCAIPPSYGGSFEVADCDYFSGWVWDKNYPDRVLAVQLMEGNTVLATTMSTYYRSDLSANGTGTGKYGFRAAIPASLRDGKPHELSIRINGTTHILAEKKIITCAMPSSFAGAFEVADCDYFSGWVWDKNYPDRVLAVQLMEGNTVLATTMSTYYRSDLASNGTGTGKYGFRAAIPASLKDGRSHELSIRINGTSHILSERKSINCGPSTALRGSIDGADCNLFKGWIWDSANPNSSQILELVEGNTVHATITADIPRSDLQFGTGNYGYNLSPLPESLKDGQPHTLAMRVKGTSYLLENSPKTITCAMPPSFAGSFEVADCDYFSGWVWDKNYPDKVLAVQLMEGNTVLATTMSTYHRSDLAANGTGTGKYGFRAAIPASLRDGKSHELSIRINGTTHILSERKSITCALPPNFAGIFEEADCGYFSGWVWDQNYPDKVLAVQLMEGNTVLATTMSTYYRADLASNGTGTGKYGFTAGIPASLKDGKPHELSIRINGTNYILSERKTITCGSGARLAVMEEAKIEHDPYQEMLVAPNPSNGKTVVTYHIDQAVPARLSIVNMLGQVVWDKVVVGSGRIEKQTIDLSDQTDGIYLVQLHTSNKIEVKRLVIIK